KHRRSKSGNYPYVEVYQFSLATLYQFTFAGDIAEPSSHISRKNAIIAVTKSA
ncbi:hypothetical protein SAMN05216412_11376, partial [Nitrosospira multiformis]